MYYNLQLVSLSLNDSLPYSILDFLEKEIKVKYLTSFSNRNLCKCSSFPNTSWLIISFRYLKYNKLIVMMTFWIRLLDKKIFLFTPQYSWNIAKVGIKHQSINQSIAWKLDLQLPMQSVPNTTNVVSSNPTNVEVYSIQHYVIKFVSDLQRVSCFLWVLWFPLIIKLTARIYLKYCWKSHYKHPNPNQSINQSINQSNNQLDKKTKHVLVMVPAGSQII